MKARPEVAETKTFRLSDRLAVTFTLESDSGMLATWEPDIPKRFTPEEAAEYRRVRGIMLERLAKRVGGAVVCIEA